MILDLIGRMVPEAFKLLPSLLAAINSGDVGKAERSARAAAQATAGRNATLEAAKAARRALRR